MEDSCIQLHLDQVVLNAEFTSVPEPRGVVIFATGSGSARHSPRNRYVAEALRSRAQLSTLLVDLLSRGETLHGAHPQPQKPGLGIEALADRLVSATNWVRSAFHLEDQPVGYLGASSGAAAALIASTRQPDVAAVVSRGGRPDLAGELLKQVLAPTLLIAGREDEALLEVNRAAQRHLAGPSELVIVPGTSYLFEEPKALDEVASHACCWFERYLRPVPERSEVSSVRGERLARRR